MDPSRLPAWSGQAGQSHKDYHQLKLELGLPGDPVLGLFERYCARAQDAFDSMEWSWKFHDGTALANRVFWLGAGGCRSRTLAHLDWLLAELGLTPAGLGADAGWQELLQNHLERALVSYAGGNPGHRRPAAIKIYLTLDGCSESVYSRSIRPLYPDLPAQPPPGDVTPLICYAAYHDGEVASRAYFLYHAGEFDKPSVAEYFGRLASPRAVEVARAHPSTGFAF